MIEARLTNDLRFILFDTEKNKEVKSFPKKGADPAKRVAAEEKYKEMKKRIQQIVSSQKELLKKSYLSKEPFPGDFWETEYLQNPVLMRIAQLLVWQQEAGEQKYYFTVRSGETINEKNQPYKLREVPIFLAHPFEMNDEQIGDWQKYFFGNGLKQLFAQVWEPVGFRDIKDIKAERYNGMRITVGHILGLEKQGLVSYVFNPDGSTYYTFADSMSIPGDIQSGARWLTEHGPSNEIIFGRIFSLTADHLRKLNRTVAYLDRLWIRERIKTDDDQLLSDLLPGKTLAQIQEYLQLTIQENAVNCQALLLDYKNTFFPDYPDVEEFIIE